MDLLDLAETAALCPLGVPSLIPIELLPAVLLSMLHRALPEQLPMASE